MSELWINMIDVSSEARQVLSLKFAQLKQRGLTDQEADQFLKEVLDEVSPGIQLQEKYKPADPAQHVIVSGKARKK